MSFRLMRSEAWFTSAERAGELWLGGSQHVLVWCSVDMGADRSKTERTSSKQASCLAWAVSSSSLGSLGTKWVIRLSMAAEILFRWLWAMIALWLCEVVLHRWS